MPDIPISKIELTGWNPRTDFNEKELDSLKESIKANGILQPLLVRPNPENGTWQLIAGERRLKAAQALKMKKVPVLIKEIDDKTAREMMFIENLQRENLNPIEEAQFIQDLISEDGQTQKELAKILGKSQPWIANRLRLLKAPGELQALIISREISAKHVIALLPYAPYPVFKKIMKLLEEKLEEKKEVSVRYLREAIIWMEVTRYNSEDVLSLDNLTYDLSDLRPFLDLSQCDGCEHVISIAENYYEPERYCLNRRCWKDKINIAKQKKEKGEKAVVKPKDNEKLLSQKEIDIGKLGSNDYNVLGTHTDPWHLKECKDCKYKKKGEDNVGDVCLDPDCYQKKGKKHNSERMKKEREEKRQVWEIVDAFIDSTHNDFNKKKRLIDFTLLRRILTLLVQSSHADALKNGLSKWPDVRKKHKYGYFVTNVVEIDDHDLLKAIIRILAAEQIAYFDKTTRKELKEFFPEAVEFHEGVNKK